jgi:hypothetical protein
MTTWTLVPDTQTPGWVDVPSGSGTDSFQLDAFQTDAFQQVIPGVLWSTIATPQTPDWQSITT